MSANQTQSIEIGAVGSAAGEPPPPASVAAGDVVAAPATVARYPLQFTGSGGEYFRIWIVNLLLTIVTLGIYSAWAKVRKLQYFHRNTRLDGSVFDYHGRPVAILKGRLIALALIVFYNLAFEFNLALGVIAALVFGGALPWLLLQSYKFKLHNSSYRGLRFRFTGEAREAYLIFGLPLAALLVVGVFFAVLAQSEAPDPAMLVPLGLVYLALALLLPYLHWRVKRFQHNASWYGQARGRFHARARGFYAIYGKSLLLTIGVIGLAVGVAVLAGGFGASADRRAGGAAVLVTLLFLVLIYAALLGIGPFIMARVQNLVWNSTLLGAVGFDSQVKARRMVWIGVSNLVLIVITLGIFTPFAAVRMYRYRVEAVSLLSTADLSLYAAQQGQEVSAVGEGAADLLDIDFAL